MKTKIQKSLSRDSFPFLAILLALMVFFSPRIYGNGQMVAPETRETLAPYDLRIEYLTNPLGVDVSQPRFFWKNNHSERGQKQAAYELIVSTSPTAEKGDMWETGKVNSDSSIQIAYEGKALQSNQTYYWKVRIWDEQGRVSPWSQVARFDTGLLSPS
ncbi:MAG: hypothetical protein JHC32_01635, partial [Candidatus Aminicenantes bacterium]|nr:hypothetical protein [Candidatus Aminicenantes bacterium]